MADQQFSLTSLQWFRDENGRLGFNEALPVQQGQQIALYLIKKWVLTQEEETKLRAFMDGISIASFLPDGKGPSNGHGLKILK